jgi:hypothetical protein
VVRHPGPHRRCLLRRRDVQRDAGHAVPRPRRKRAGHRAGDRHGHRPLSTAIDCYTDANLNQTDCTYRWTFDGRTYTEQSEDSAQDVPDGTQVSIRIDPHDPDAPAVIDQETFLGYFMMALGLTVGAVCLCVIYGAERDLRKEEEREDRRNARFAREAG